MLAKNRALYIGFDTAALLIAFCLAAVLRRPVLAGKSTTELMAVCFWMVCIYILVILFYQPRRPIFKRNAWNELRAVGTINFFIAVIMALILYLFKAASHFPRSFYLTLLGLNILWMYLGRVLLKRLVVLYYDRNANRKRLLICTNEGNALKVLHKFCTSQLF